MASKSAALAFLPALLLAFLTALLYFVTYQVFCAALVSIVAWNSVVKTLELNDFRHKIKKSSLRGSRYIAALVATRLGLRDALLDWAIVYSLGYAIVAGFTWNDSDPNSLLVLWGFSVIIGSLILAVLGLKVPHWLGLYPKSGLSLISDTSNLAKPALEKLIDGGSIIEFRYQVRLAIGSHFAKFHLLLLPFYVGLKVWWFLASVIIGCGFGYTYMYIIYQSRMKFDKHCGTVALLASAYMSVASSLLFMRGMDIANKSWNLSFAKDSNILMLVSFFGWLLLCLLLQAASYNHYYNIHHAPREFTVTHFSNEAERASLFDESIKDGCTQGEDVHYLDTVVEDDESGTDGLEEPLIGRRDLFKKEPMDDARMSYFYQTGYFDPSNMRTKDELVERENRGSVVLGSSCKQNYNLVVAEENAGQSPMKWYAHLWLALPVKPACDIFLLGWSKTFSCCRKESDFKNSSICNKLFFVISRIVGIFLTLYALYVAIVACMATYQISITKAKLPYVNEKLYMHMNEDAVCAFDQKGGDIKTFPTKEAAHVANYQIAHCGSCGRCSTWVDLELQWSTRKTLAKKSQKCGIKSLTGGFNALQECLEGPMIGGTHGFTPQCAKCWADDIMCTKRFCVFIYLQTRMTNQVGNFKVGPESITSATCEEANCEAGNPGDFVYCVGANRRRMNIASDIARPKDQQCNNVDIESWDEFFPPRNFF